LGGEGSGEWGGGGGGGGAGGGGGGFEGVRGGGNCREWRGTGRGATDCVCCGGRDGLGGLFVERRRGAGWFVVEVGNDGFRVYSSRKKRRGNLMEEGEKRKRLKRLKD